VLNKKLEPVWVNRSTVFGKYVTLVASADRVLAVTLACELVLFDATAGTGKPINRLAVLADENGCYSHPAFVGTRMYLRGENELVCVELKP
jgi:hypothetical protein